MEAVTIELPVQWGDQDAFGHVNNVVYFRWLESGRVAFMGEVAMMAPQGTPDVGPIVASATANYRRQLTFPDTVRISTCVRRIGRSSVTFGQEIRRQGTGELAADGEAVVVWFDYRKGESVPLPAELREALERYLR